MIGILNILVNVLRDLRVMDVRGVRARSARILIMSLKYHCITHEFENILIISLKYYEYYSLISSNVTKCLSRASRSNAGTSCDPKSSVKSFRIKDCVMPMLCVHRAVRVTLQDSPRPNLTTEKYKCARRT